jgi:hypothetical protein
MNTKLTRLLPLTGDIPDAVPANQKYLFWMVLESSVKKAGFRSRITRVSRSRLHLDCIYHGLRTKATISIKLFAFSHNIRKEPLWLIFRFTTSAIWRLALKEMCAGFSMVFHLKSNVERP